MKKIGVLLMFAVLLSFAANAQKGKKQFNVGVGFDSHTIPVYVGLDYWVHQDISIGGSIGWRRYNFDWDKNYHYTLINFAVPANYHASRILGLPQAWDLYAGLSVGFYHWSDNYNDKNYKRAHNSGLGLGGQIGIRYFFNSKIGVNLEFGGGNQVSDGKLGLTILF